MTNTEAPTLKVVGEIPATHTGSRGKPIYDETFSLVVQSHPEAVLFAEKVKPHRAVSLREALAVRLARPENESLSERGQFIVQTRVTDEPGLVNIYVAFVEYGDEDED